MTIHNELAQLIVDIIDSRASYKVVRRPYDEEFAKAHGITLEDITSMRFVPCLECGADVASRVLTRKTKGKVPVYCSSECRGAHSMLRLTKLGETTNINELVRQLVAKGLTVEASGNAPVIRKNLSRHTLAGAVNLTNELLSAILQEIQNARKA